MTYIVRRDVAQNHGVAILFAMNSASNTVLANLSMIPSELHPALLALLADSAKLASITSFVGGATASVSVSTAKEPVDAKHADGALAPLSPLQVTVKPRSAESAPKRIYVTAPTYIQKEHRVLVEGAIAAIKKLWPSAEVVDANTCWPDGERRGPAWESGFSDLIKTVDMVLVVTGEDGWVGGGIEREMQIAHGAGRYVVAARTPGGSIFLFYQNPPLEKYRGAGSKSHVPKSVRQGVVGHLVLDESNLFTLAHN
jgi:hypothetical protein